MSDCILDFTVTIRMAVPEEHTGNVMWLEFPGGIEVHNGSTAPVSTKLVSHQTERVDEDEESDLT